LAGTQQCRDLYAAQRIAIQAAREAGELATLNWRIATAKQQQDLLVRQLDEIPAIDGEAVEKLRQFEQPLQQARFTVELLATKIELKETGDHEAQLDDAPLVVGEPHIITDPASLTILGSTRLLITPGGGTSLATARQTHDAATEQFHNRLNELGVIDIRAATDRLARRQQLEQQIVQQDRDRANLLDGHSEEDLLNRGSRQAAGNSPKRGRRLPPSSSGVTVDSPQSNYLKNLLHSTWRFSLSRQRIRSSSSRFRSSRPPTRPLWNFSRLPRQRCTNNSRR
jgi:hypothetical protein